MLLGTNGWKLGATIKITNTFVCEQPKCKQQQLIFYFYVFTIDEYSLGGIFRINYSYICFILDGFRIIFNYVEDAGERLGYCITLLLAEVVNIQWAFNTLPNVPYLTIIERYIYASFIFLFIVTSYSCLVCGILYNDFNGLFGYSADDVDEGFGWFFLAANCSVQAYFYLHCLNARRAERKHLMAQTIAYRERRPTVPQAVDLPIAFDENSIDQCAASGQKKFSGLALTSQSKDEMEKMLH